MNKRVGVALGGVAVLGVAVFAVTVLVGGSSPSQAATVPSFTDPTVLSLTPPLGSVIKPAVRISAST